MDLGINQITVLVLYVHVNSALPKSGMMITNDWEEERERLLDLVSTCYICV